MARDYQVKIDLKSNVEKQLNKVDKSLDKVQKNLGGFGSANKALAGTRSALSRIAGLNPYAAAAAGAVALGAAAFGAVAGAAALTNQLRIAEERTGIAAEKLSEYQQLLNLTSDGAELEDLQEAIINVSERFGEAATDAGGIRDALNALGFDNQELIDLTQFATADEQFQAFAKSVQGLSDTELTFRLKEIGGDDLFRVKSLLKEIGQEGEAAQKLASLDLVTSSTTLNNLSEYNDSIKVSKAIFADIATELGGAIAPAITGILNSFNSIVDYIGGTDTIIAAWNISFGRVFQTVAVVFEAISDIYDVLNSTLNLIVELGPKIKAFITDKFIEAKAAVVGFIESIPGGSAALSGIAKATDAIGDGIGAVAGAAKSFGDSVAVASSVVNNELRSTVAGWRDNEQAANQYAEAANKARAAFNTGNATEYRDSIVQAAEAQAVVAQQVEAANQKAAAASNVFRQSAKQVIEQFGDVTVDVRGNAVEKLEQIQKQFNALTNPTSSQSDTFNAASESLNKFINDIDVKASEQLQKQRDADNKRLEQINKAAVKEREAVDKRRDDLLSSINKYSSIDTALDDQLAKIGQALTDGSIDVDTSAQLELVAEIQARIDRDSIDDELRKLNSSALDVSSININARVNNASEAVAEIERIFSAIESDRVEVETNFKKTFSIDPETATALQETLNAEIDVQGVDALNNLVNQFSNLSVLGDINFADGVESEITKLEAPLIKLKKQLAESLNISEGSNTVELLVDVVKSNALDDVINGISGGFESVLDLKIETTGANILQDGAISNNADQYVSEFKKAVTASQELIKAAGGDAENLAQATAEATQQIFKDISVIAPSLDLGDLDGSAEQVNAFKDVIEQLQIVFPEINFDAFLDSSDAALQALKNNVADSLSDVIGSIGSGGSQIASAFAKSIAGAFGGGEAGAAAVEGLQQFEQVLSNGFAQSAQIQNTQFQQSLDAFKTAEAEKTSFYQNQQAFRDASSNEDVLKATESLNKLLSQYQISNDDLNALGLDRSASAQAISNAIVSTRSFETDALRQQAQKQEAQAKKAFEADKAFRLAQATVSGIAAIQNAYAWGSSFGGPLGGAAAAAIAGIATLQNIKAIKSTSFGGSGGVLSAGGSAGGDGIAQADAGGNSSTLDNASDSIDGSRRSGAKSITIDFQGRSSISSDEALDMIEAIKELSDEGFDTSVIA